MLWHATTLLREHRWDGHMATLLTEGVDGCETHLTYVGTGEVSRATMQPIRGWSDEEWDAAANRLQQRGMLDETLVIWGGEFGRTVYSQGALTKDNYGRDHHGRCFTMWMAGGGARPGTVYGETDEFSYNIIKDPVHIHDFHATVLHLLGFDHQRFSVRYQGLDQRLTGVEPCSVIKQLLA